MEEESEVPGENHQPAVSQSQTLSHKVEWSPSFHTWESNSQL